jgi:hypothetical protein
MKQSKAQSVIVWVHSDCLNNTGPALAAYPEAPALWVWDEDLLRNWLVTIYQSRFIYECLLKLPVTIQRGDVVTEIIRFAKEHGVTRVATTSTCNPGFLQICRELKAAGLSVEIHEDVPMLTTESARSVDSSRFSPFWQQAQPAVAH